LHRPLVLSGIGDERRQVFDRKVLARDQHRRLIGDQHHRRQIGGEIVERVLVERLVDGVGAAAEHELIAVGRGLRHPRRADHAAGTAHIFDDHLLAQHLGKPPADDASEHVGAAAGRERHHHGQRAVGPVLRGGFTDGEQATERDSGDQRYHASRTHHGSPTADGMQGSDGGCRCYIFTSLI
jgi:hypothetical protein